MARRAPFQRRLVDTLGTVVLALVLAVVVWVNAMYQNDRPLDDWFPEPIPIEVLNAPTGLAVVNSPERYVNVRITAFASSWSSLTAKSFHATADWGNLGEGNHTVPVKVTCADRTVTIEGTQPEMIYTHLERLDTGAIEVTVEVRDPEEIPLGYSFEVPEVEPRFVRVDGPVSKVERVAAVVASVSLAGERADVERVVEPRALDINGEVVSGLELTPATVTIRFDIEKKRNIGEVAVRYRTVGQPARGYFVSSVGVDPAIVTVEGPPAHIADMEGQVFTKGEVVLTGASRTLYRRLELDLPDGVSVLTETEDKRTRIWVVVEIQAVPGGTTVELPIEARRAQEGLVTKLSVSTVDIIVTGPAVLLDDLQIDLLDAYVDLSGLGVGKHQVKTIVDILVEQNPDLADLEVTSISPASVEVDISEIPTPTQSPTQTPTLTLTPSPTPTMQRTIPITITVTGTLTVTATPTITGTTTPTMTVVSTIPPAPTASMTVVRGF